MNGKSVLLCLAAIALLLWPLAGIAEENDMTGIFDFENRTVLLNSGYTMPILGLGTYALDHDTCVSSVMALLESGGRLIDTAYMYGNEEAVGEGVRRGMEAYAIPREDIFVITKIYPNQFSDPEAAIDMALGTRSIPTTRNRTWYHSSRARALSSSAGIRWAAEAIPPTCWAMRRSRRLRQLMAFPLLRSSCAGISNAVLWSSPVPPIRSISKRTSICSALN